MRDAVDVDGWVDLVCPWCYIGKRRLDAALATYEHADEVTLRWRSFELSPDAPVTPSPDSAQALADVYGITREQAVQMQARVTAIAAADGLEYHLDRAQLVRTYDAHRLVRLAASYGSQTGVVEALFSAHLVEGRSIADPAVLADIGVRAGGMDELVVTDMLDSSAYALEMVQEQQTAQRLGITAVPHFVVDHEFALTGAQPVARLLELLGQARGEEDATAARLRGGL